MWFNAWGLFNDSSGSLQQLTQTPFPLLPGSPDRAEAWDRLSSIIPCLGLIWVTRDMVIQQPRLIRTVAKTIFWTGSAVALLGLMQRWTGAEGIYWNHDLVQPEQWLFFGTYRSPGIATCYLNIAFAMGLTMMLSPESMRDLTKKRLRSAYSMLHISASIILLISVITAGSKAGMVFALLTLILWAVLNRRAIGGAFYRSTHFFSGHRRLERNLTAGVLLIITILGTLSFAGTMSQRWQSAHEGGYASLSGRGVVNAIQIEMIQDPAWGALGFGPGAFYPLFPYFSEGSDIGGVYVYGHNDYLQTLVEWGWLGTSVFAVLIAGGFFCFLRELFSFKESHAKSTVIYIRGYLIAMTTMLLHAMVDFPFQIESIAVTFSVILGIAWAVPSLRPKDCA